jgi:hypothetical protein
MLDNCGCYSQEKLLSCSFMKDEVITNKSILNSEIPLKDKYWFFCKKVLSKEQNQQIAISCSELVLPIYENKYLENKAPREAIEAAKLYITGHISLDELLLKKRAAAAASSAAAAFSAYAADAADAAFSAAAASAADAAADAAFSAAAASAADAADAAFFAAAAAVVSVVSVADAAFSVAAASAAAYAAYDAETKTKLFEILKSYL